MADNDQGIQPDDQGQPVVPESLGWRAGLSDEHKEDAWAKTHSKVSDFFKDALGIKTERDALAGKLDGAIFKPDQENATDEQKAAYRTAMGIPDTPDEYEFPKGDGIEHDPKMVDWAKNVFHTAGLSKDQAGVISQAWDGFISEMGKAQIDSQKKAITETETALKTEWGADYDKNIELTKRGYEAFSAKLPGFKEFLDQTVVGKKTVGNHPIMSQLFHILGQAIGEDFSLPGTPKAGKSGEVVPGMNYETMGEFDSME